MKLKSFGCSFIFGSDLSDCNVIPNTHPVGKFSRSTWPAIMAKKLGYEYECLARPGAGNLHIAETVLSEATANDNDLFVIGWSWIDRFDFTDSDLFDDRVKFQWVNCKTLHPTDTSALAENYYKHLHSEFRDKFTSLISIKTVIDTLNQKNIAFLMTYVDDLLFDTRWNTSPAVRDLQNFVRPSLTDFQGSSFLQWCRSNGFQESQGFHPLEPAHQAAAEYMFKVFDKQKTSGLVQQVRV